MECINHVFKMLCKIQEAPANVLKDLEKLLLENCESVLLLPKLCNSIFSFLAFAFAFAVLYCNF